MTTATAYTMDAFLDDVRETFASTGDPMAQAQAVADNLKTLINTPGWLEEMLDLPEEGGYGPKSLHLEEEAGHPKPGFWLMASVQEDGRDNLPHDHGNAWVVYGVYDGAIEQTKWRWFYPGEGVDRLQLKETGQFSGLLPARRDSQYPQRQRRPRPGGAPGVPEAGPPGPLPVQPRREHHEGDGPVAIPR